MAEIAGIVDHPAFRNFENIKTQETLSFDLWSLVFDL